MRILSVIVLATFCFVSLACGVRLQPAVQGEWSNFHNDKDKISQNARPEAEKPSAEAVSK
jgi:hypothetical protein